MDRMETLIWRQFEIKHPDDWEMLQFGCGPDTGRCILADRHQYRLEFNWRRFDAPPDWQRTLSDYGNKLKTDHSNASIRPVETSGWNGLDISGKEMNTSRFGRFFGEESCLLEIVFIWPEAKDSDLTRDVLESVRERPSLDGTTRWRAFGMDLQASETVTLQACVVEPARAEMRFGNGKSPIPTELFQRLGLVPNWLKGSVPQWLEMQVSSDVIDIQQSGTTIRGHDIACVEGILQQGPLRRLVRKPPKLRAAAWQCPQDGRLYCATCTDRSEGEATRLPGRRLACCPSLASGIGTG